MKPNKRLDALVLNDKENPCGLECVPFNDTYCFLNNSGFPELESSKSIITKNKQENVVTVARTVCRLLVNAQNLAIDYSEASEAAKFWKSIAEALTMDQLTGLITGNGFNAIVEELYKPSMLAELINKNYYAQIIYADINDLKNHNSGPGGHFQGNRAIEAIGKAIKQYIEAGRRSTQLLRETQDDRRNKLRIPRTIAARHHENGDEFVVIILNKGRSKTGTEEINKQINELFSNVEYTYDNQSYKVTATYGITEVKFPNTREELENALKLLDKSMMDYKEIKKTNPESAPLMGTYLNL